MGWATERRRRRHFTLGRGWTSRNEGEDSTTEPDGGEKMTPADELRYSAFVGNELGSIYVDEYGVPRFEGQRSKLNEAALRKAGVDLPRDPQIGPEADGRRREVLRALQSRRIPVVSAATRFLS